MAWAPQIGDHSHDGVQSREPKADGMRDVAIERGGAERTTEPHGTDGDDASTAAIPGDQESP